MKLQILSDLHINLGGDVTIPDVGADVVILAGDISKGLDSIQWIQQTIAKPTLLVLGNHEISAGNDSKLQRFHSLANNSVVTVLEKSTVEINGVRFLGCTLWSPSKMRSRRAMEESIQWLQEMLTQPYPGKTVVITHYPPLYASLDDVLRRDFALMKRITVDLTELIETSCVSLWVHGHVHVFKDYECGQTRIVCNPRGYNDREVQHFSPEYTVDIEL